MDLAPAGDVQILKIRDGLLKTKPRKNKRKQSISEVGKCCYRASIFYLYISQVFISEQITPQNKIPGRRVNG